MTGVNHVFPAMSIVLPQQKVRKIDHVRSTCVLVGLKDVQRFSVHLLLVSFGHCTRGYLDSLLETAQEAVTIAATRGHR